MEIRVNPNCSSQSGSTQSPAALLDEVLSGDTSNNFVSKERLFELIDALDWGVNNRASAFDYNRSRIFEFLDTELTRDEFHTIIAVYGKFYNSKTGEIPYIFYDRSNIQILTNLLAKRGESTDFAHFYAWLKEAVRPEEAMEELKNAEINELIRKQIETEQESYRNNEISKTIRQKIEELPALKQKTAELLADYHDLEPKCTDSPANPQVNIGDLLRLKVAELLMDNKISAGKAAILLSIVH